MDWNTKISCPPDCDGTYTNSGHLGGWSSDHNGYCRHGTYVAGSGVDWICGYCEDGDDVDGFFECVEHHLHDRTGLPGPKYEGAPCPNDPESPNAYPPE